MVRSLMWLVGLVLLGATAGVTPATAADGGTGLRQCDRDFRECANQELLPVGVTAHDGLVEASCAYLPVPIGGRDDPVRVCRGGWGGDGSYHHELVGVRVDELELEAYAAGSAFFDPPEFSELGLRLGGDRLGLRSRCAPGSGGLCLGG